MSRCSMESRAPCISADYPFCRLWPILAGSSGGQAVYDAHQWEQLRTVFDHSDFKRTGYNDLFTNVDKYVDFLEEIVPTFGADYELETERIVYAPGEKAAFAQLIEHLELKGVMTDIPETIIFDLNDEGLIRRTHHP
jgi:hypothetical protein